MKFELFFRSTDICMCLKLLQGKDFIICGNTKDVGVCHLLGWSSQKCTSRLVAGSHDSEEHT